MKMQPFMQKSFYKEELIKGKWMIWHRAWASLRIISLEFMLILALSILPLKTHWFTEEKGQQSKLNLLMNLNSQQRWQVDISWETLLIRHSISRGSNSHFIRKIKLWRILNSRNKKQLRCKIIHKFKTQFKRLNLSQNFLKEIFPLLLPAIVPIMIKQWTLAHHLQNHY